MQQGQKQPGFLISFDEYKLYKEASEGQQVRTEDDSIIYTFPITDDIKIVKVVYHMESNPQIFYILYSDKPRKETAEVIMSIITEKKVIKMYPEPIECCIGVGNCGGHNDEGR